MGLSREQVEQHIAGVKKRLTNEQEVGGRAVIYGFRSIANDESVKRVAGFTFETCTHTHS